MVTAEQVGKLSDEFIEAVKASAANQPVPAGTSPGAARAASETLGGWAQDVGSTTSSANLLLQGWTVLRGVPYATVGGTVMIGKESAAAFTWQLRLTPVPHGWDVDAAIEAAMFSADGPALVPVTTFFPVMLLACALAVITLLWALRAKRRPVALRVLAVACVVAALALLSFPTDDSTVQQVEGINGAAVSRWPVPGPEGPWFFENGQGEMYGGVAYVSALRNFWMAVGCFALALCAMLWPGRRDKNSAGLSTNDTARPDEVLSGR